MRFDCACSDTGDVRCGEHLIWPCHNGNVTPDEYNPPECPPCHLARLRSVSLASKATPTRGKR